MRTLRALQTIHPRWGRSKCRASLKARQRDRVTWVLEKQYIQMTALLKMKGRKVHIDIEGTPVDMTWEGLRAAFINMGVSVTQAVDVFQSLMEAIDTPLEGMEATVGPTGIGGNE